MPGQASLRRDSGRHGVAVGLLLGTAVAWGLFAWPAIDMNGLPARLMMPASAAWSAANVAAVFGMWAVMMVAMMLPGAIPMVSMYGRLVGREAPGAVGRRVGMFVSGYLLAWCGYALVATLLQWALQAALVVSPMGLLTSRWVAAVLLAVAGGFQFTPLKDACLERCRSPFGFLLSEWRPGSRGAAVMGLRHGAYCIGCCWALMALAFVGGTMSLGWMALLTLLVTVEKVLPRGDAIARGIGALLVAGGSAWALALALAPA